MALLYSKSQNLRESLTNAYIAQIFSFVKEVDEINYVSSKYDSLLSKDSEYVFLLNENGVRKLFHSIVYTGKNR